MTDNWHENYKLHFAAQDGNMDAVMKFLEEGACVNEFDQDLGWTPLHHAAKAEQLDVVKYLITQGADVNARDEQTVGETPLGLIAQGCSFEIAKLLVDAGADPTISGWMQLTALDRARKRKKPEGIKVYELLKEAVAKV